MRSLLRSTVLAAAAAAPVAAQVSSTVDAGVIGARYAGGDTQGGAVLAPALRLQQSHATLDAGGSVATFNRGAPNLQWFVGASAFTPALSLRGARFAGEIAAGADGYSEESFHAGHASASGRAHLYQEDGGVWVEGGAGRARREDASGSLLLGGLGAWWRTGPATLTLALTHTRYNPRPSDLDPSLATPRDAFTDVGAGVQWSKGLLDFDAGAGARTATTQSALSAWGTITGALWLARRTAVIVALAQSPEDPTRGLNAGASLSFGMRIGSRAPRRRVLPREQMSPPRDFVLGGDERGESTIRVELPGAHKVELMGDFTDWTPVALASANGRDWTVALPLRPGTYHVVVRIDGGPWRVPPGYPSTDDEFSGKVGLVVVR
ncbi:MAG: glycogen-binding domain-containing protein [Gemmatimonadota bacterium]|nr:glycogen-binding domain-containing protein [Gemmatimonadota bacterium]